MNDLVHEFQVPYLRGLTARLWVGQTKGELEDLAVRFGPLRPPEWWAGLSPATRAGVLQIMGNTYRELHEAREVIGEPWALYWLVLISRLLTEGFVRRMFPFVPVVPPRMQQEGLITEYFHSIPPIEQTNPWSFDTLLEAVQKEIASRQLRSLYLGASSIPMSRVHGYPADKFFTTVAEAVWARTASPQAVWVVASPDVMGRWFHNIPHGVLPGPGETVCLHEQLFYQEQAIYVYVAPASWVTPEFVLAGRVPSPLVVDDPDLGLSSDAWWTVYALGIPEMGPGYRDVAPMGLRTHPDPPLVMRLASFSHFTKVSLDCYVKVMFG